MKPNEKELLPIGLKLGHLEIIEVKQNGKQRKSYLCKCDCGNIKVLPHKQLIPNKARPRADRSCGCKAYAHKGIIMENKRLYGIWYQMNKRCSNPKAENYERYGAQGVYVVDEWKNDYTAFYKWSMENGYKDNLTIDRIDLNKPYSPDNCRWVDYNTQNQNKGLFKSNKTGVTGVSKYKYGYKAAIRRDGLQLNLGTFKTLEEAKSERLKAEQYYADHKTLKGFK